MSKQKFNLVVTAHPDDETIFMGGTIMTQRDFPWYVICVTDGNADGMGAIRAVQLKEAGEKLGVAKMEHWDFEDLFEKRLPVDKLVERLRSVSPDFSLWERVYTHNPVGEYGHPHHQDVSFAAHKVFADKVETVSIAYNSLPERWHVLSPEIFLKKQEILNSTYFSETERFIQLLPATFAEGFCRVSVEEVSAIYDFLSGRGELRRKDIRVFEPLIPYLLSERGQFSNRL